MFSAHDASPRTGSLAAVHKLTGGIAKTLTTGSTVFWCFHSLYWGGIWGIRELFVTAYAGSEAVTSPHLPARLLACFMLTAALRAFSLRRDLLNRVGLSQFGALTGGAISLAAALTLFRQYAEPVVGAPRPAGPAEAGAIFVIYATTLLGWTFFYLTFRLIEDYDASYVRELEARAAADRNELKHLQATMDPHFLFNALSAVMACKGDPDEVERVTQALADYLRFSLRDTAPLEPLGRELDALDDYIAIQDARFGADLACTISCEQQVRTTLVPPMLIQPLLENALKYGADTSERPLRVAVSAEKQGESVVIQVANTGRWLAPGHSASSGLGLRTLRTRLRLLYGSTAAVNHNTQDGWVYVSVRLPVPLPLDSSSQYESREVESHKEVAV